MKRREFLKQLGSAPAVGAGLNLTPIMVRGQETPESGMAGKGEVSETLPPWADTIPERWRHAGKAKLYTDLSHCQPASALGLKSRRGQWRVIPYEACGKAGNLLWASAGAKAPPVRLPLDVKGWHAIFVGLYTTVVSSPINSLVWLKLKGDAASQARVSTRYSPYGSFEEAFFKVADLDGGFLQIEQQSKGLASDCGVVWVKLIPLDESEIAGLLADRNQQGRRRLAATNDYGFLANGPTTEEEILREVEIYRDTDFDTLLLHVGGGDGLSHISQYSDPLPEDLVFPWEGYRYHFETLRELARRKINPTKVLIKGAHDLGMKIHVAIRPAAWSYYEPLQEFSESAFYRAHPEWRCEDRDGTPVARMSWAVRQVRERLINVLRESTEWGADGAHVVFNRGLPVVLYEQPFREVFSKQYGEDPRTLSEESDPRIREAWAGVVTDFMREARRMLDKEEKRRGDGKRLALSAMVFGNEEDNMRYGLDVRHWVSEGLVDEIFTYRWDIGAKKRVDDLKFFLDICRPKGVAFRPSFHPDRKYSSIKEAISAYRDGIQGLTFWDARDIVQRKELWTLSRFGHADELPLREELEKAGSTDPQRIRFHRLGDQVMDGRFPPYWSG